jgi:hypothetical protein
MRKGPPNLLKSQQEILKQIPIMIAVTGTVLIASTDKPTAKKRLQIA